MLRQCGCGCGEWFIPKRLTGTHILGHAHRKTLVSRFWNHVITGAGCWSWRGPTHSYGYGRITLYPSRKHISGHRLSWEIHYGEIPAGLCVLHRCDHPACTNPDHLFLGTFGDNALDRTAKGKSCSGEMNGSAKLTASAVLEIRALTGILSRAAAGRKYSISRSQVIRIQSGTSWRHLRG